MRAELARYSPVRIQNKTKKGEPWMRERERAREREKGCVCVWVLPCVQRDGGRRRGDTFVTSNDTILALPSRRNLLQVLLHF
jgi:hypothetical protein